MIGLQLRSKRPVAPPPKARTIDGSRGGILTALDLFIDEVEGDWTDITAVYGAGVRASNLAEYYGVSERRARYAAWVIGRRDGWSWDWSRMDKNKLLRRVA